ncbi:uncharacterized protein TNCV_1638131 [Trichonephila clavipes]|nr:uncharacterized protein TNCV_1638131 [Trichonephila clavipes]
MLDRQFENSLKIGFKKCKANFVKFYVNGVSLALGPRSAGVYTGFCPDMAHRIGQNYTNTTREVIRERPHLRGRLGSIRRHEVQNAGMTYRNGEGFECHYDAMPEYAQGYTVSPSKMQNSKQPFFQNQFFPSDLGISSLSPYDLLSYMFVELKRFTSEQDKILVDDTSSLYFLVLLKIEPPVMFPQTCGQLVKERIKRMRILDVLSKPIHLVVVNMALLVQINAVMMNTASVVDKAMGLGPLGTSYASVVNVMILGESKFVMSDFLKEWCKSLDIATAFASAECNGGTRLGNGLWTKNQHTDFLRYLHVQVSIVAHLISPCNASARVGNLWRR